MESLPGSEVPPCALQSAVEIHVPLWPVLKVQETARWKMLESPKGAAETKEVVERARARARRTERAYMAMSGSNKKHER